MVNGVSLLDTGAASSENQRRLRGRNFAREDVSYLPLRRRRVRSQVSPVVHSGDGSDRTPLAGSRSYSSRDNTPVSLLAGLILTLSAIYWGFVTAAAPARAFDESINALMHHASSLPLWKWSKRGGDTSYPTPTSRDAATVTLTSAEPPLVLSDLGEIDLGLRLDETLTSTTYKEDETWPARLIRSVAESFLGPEFIVATDSAPIISADTTSNTCWPLSGSYGTIGVLFPRVAQVFSVTVQFTASPTLARRVGVPGRFRLWGLVSPADAKVQLPTECTTPTHDFPPHLIPVLYNLHPVFLSEWLDDTAAWSKGIVPLSPCSVPVEVVVLEIWGQDSAPFTCINRILFHGRKTTSV